MNVSFLGRWSSNLVAGERNVCFVLDEVIAFDCGPHAVASLLDRGMDPAGIEILLISHMHLDHYVGIAELLWYRSIHRSKNRLTVVGPAGIEECTRRLMSLVNTPEPWCREQIDTNVVFREDADQSFVRVFRAHHTIPANAYRVEYEGKVIFYSGDTTYSEEVVEGARGVDCLVHEMTYTDADRESADYWCHSTYSDALAVFAQSGAKRLVPVHLTRATSALASNAAGEVAGLIFPSDVLEL